MQDLQCQENAITNNEQLWSFNKYEKKFQNQIQNQSLRIEGNKHLKSLEFIRFCQITKLELENCKNVILKLESQIIKSLNIIDCEISSIKDLQLENLEVLTIKNCYKIESKSLVFEIVKFKYLKELTLCNCVIDISPLSLTSLKHLYLHGCELSCFAALRLYNLEKLKLINNTGVEITSLQFFTALTSLALYSGDFVSVDALRPLTKLQNLYINNKQIVYLQPLMEMKDLSDLSATNNYIIDIELMQQHPNFKNFDLRHQKQPKQQQITEANIQRAINAPITTLKLMQHQKLQYNIQRNKFTEYIQKQYDRHSTFIARVATILYQMNNAEVDQ
ncbi:internalin_A [Hexamita inflata]|uniref:Internalin A n=1 Tax=Hexamita inflata TaxID=28002 RepID=A0AA86PM70_9EUKA|nr:internalin A [Hexamita inflata]